MPSKKDNTPATHHDLEIWGGRLQLEIEGVKKEINDNTEKLLIKFAKEITDHIDAAVEIQAGNILGANKDEIHLIKNKVDDHEERIQQLEKI